MRATKLGSLEIGRFIAATLVVLSHLGPSVAKYGNIPVTGFLRTFDAGAIAVQFFFVLSGFVMATAHQRDFANLRAVPKFLWRRACRIYPLYWLAVLMPFYYQFHNINAAMAFRFLSLAPVATSELLPPTWTLRFEVAFYLGFSLCLLPYIGRPILASWLILSLWFNDSTAFQQHHLAHPSSFFVFGIIAGLAFSKLIISKLQLLCVAVICVSAFCAVLSISQWGFNYPTPAFEISMAAIIAVLILCISSAETSGLFQTGRIAAILGAMSYPLYILHWTVFIIYDQVFGSIRLGSDAIYGLYALAIVVIYALALFITVFFDLPVQRLLRRVSA